MRKIALSVFIGVEFFSLNGGRCYACRSVSLNRFWIPREGEKYPEKINLIN